MKPKFKVGQKVVEANGYCTYYDVISSIVQYHQEDRKGFLYKTGTGNHLTEGTLRKPTEKELLTYFI